MYSSRVMLPFSFVVWNSQFLVYSVKRDVKFNALGLRANIRLPKIKNATWKVLLLTTAGYFPSPSAHVVQCGRLPGTQFCTRQTCLEPAGHFC